MPKAPRLPRTLRLFERRYPAVWQRYHALRDACDAAGPLPPKTRELIKIGIEAAKKRHGGLAAHIVRARRAGATNAEIYQTLVLAAPLIGLPDVLDAFLVAEKHVS